MERLNLAYYYGQEAEQFTFYRLPKALFTDERFRYISNGAKILYGLMLDRMGLSARSGWHDEENRVFIKYSVKSIMEDLNCSKGTAVSVLRELEYIGLVDMVQRSGQANIIYVKNFISSGVESEQTDLSKDMTSANIVPVQLDYTGAEIEPVENMYHGEQIPCTGADVRPVGNTDQSETEKNGEIVRNNPINEDKIQSIGEYSCTSPNFEPVQKTDREKNDGGTSQKIEQPPVQILDSNNNYFNNTKLKNNNQNHIYPGTGMNEIDEATAYMELIRENISYDVLMSDERWTNRKLFDELYQLICDIVCVPRKTVRIAGEDYPYALVKSKFLKLNSDHLEYVIRCVEKNTTKISNIKSYMLTALYNAPNTISLYYTAEVNHDMYGSA